MQNASSTPKLQVEDLHIHFATPDGPMHAVRGVSFNLSREKLEIVGESGSGKSTVGRALLKLHPRSAKIEARRLAFDGIDLLDASPKTMQAIRGKRMSMIMQDPKYSLNPVVRVGQQIAEAYLAHNKVSRAEATDRALAMLESVRIREPQRVFNLYPHEVSGGMGQRAMIAMMLIAEPDILIADEPTSALDVTVQLQVLSILDALVVERGMCLILVSHDLRLVSSFCDRILVMYAGRVVEELAAGGLAHAQHTYTRGLMACLPQLGASTHPLATLDRRPEWAL